MLRNWSKWSVSFRWKISFRSRNFEIISKFSKFFDIDRNWSKLIEIFQYWSKFRSISIVFENLPNFRNDRNSSKSLSKRSKFFEITIKTIEILRNYYWKDRNSSKLLLKRSKFFEIWNQWKDAIQLKHTLSLSLSPSLSLSLSLCGMKRRRPIKTLSVWDEKTPAN